MSLKFLTISAFLVSACAASIRPIPLTLEPLHPNGSPDRNLERDQGALASYIQKNPSDRETVRDAMLILDARTADQRGDLDQAVKLWFEALQTAKGSFGEKAFSGWVKAYSKKLGKKLEKGELARQILAELKGGSASPWLIARTLTTEQKIIPFLQKEIPDALEPESSLVVNKLDAPTTPGISSSDPLMTNLAAEICKLKSQQDAGLEKWQKTLSADVSKYFDALVAQCNGQIAKAISSLSEVAPRMATNPSTVPLALEGFSRLIKMRRDQGERESVAPLYLPFMKVWKHPSITEASLGLSRSAFEQRRIDDVFWAARARAGVGDAGAARILAEEVLEHVEFALTQSYNLTPEQKNSLLSTAGEGYHFLAFRLAVEARDWDKASGITQLALDRHSLPLEWRNRLRWSLGFYRYLANDFDQSRRIWEELLTDANDEKLRPMLMFWVSQAHNQLKNTSEALFYRKSLAQDYPLSFYSVVALKQAKGGFEDAWKSHFKDIHGLNKSLRDWQKADVDDLRADSNRGPLLRRAEIFTSLGLSQFSNYSIEELQKSFESQNGSERAAAWGLYVSRLYAAGGNWLGAISTTSKLSKDPEFWKNRPEQMLVYFPRPYGEYFDSIAREMNLSPEMLMGISRQESSFRPEVKSAANAWGLMQLTPPTAKRLLSAAGFSDPSVVKIPEDLLKPEWNIRFGATFVRQLEERYSSSRPQMFAAYNAGTQTVENWNERRLFDDPLIFIELIPYQETRDYVKGVWRNEIVYSFLSETTSGMPNK